MVSESPELYDDFSAWKDYAAELVGLEAEHDVDGLMGRGRWIGQRAGRPV